MIRDNAFALKFNYHTFVDDNIPNAEWIKHPSEYDGPGLEFAYEHRLKTKYWIGVGCGRFFKKQSYIGYLVNNDEASINIDNFYVSITALYKSRIREGTIFYIGFGPDFYHTKTEFEYASADIYIYNKNYNTAGFHGTAGLEYIFFENPFKYHFYMMPTGIFFEYKVTRVIIEDVTVINAEEIPDNEADEYQYQDKSLSTHMFYCGIKWHF